MKLWALQFREEVKKEKVVFTLLSFPFLKEALNKTAVSMTGF